MNSTNNVVNPKHAGEAVVFDDDLLRDNLPGLAPIYEEDEWSWDARRRDPPSFTTLPRNTFFYGKDPPFFTTLPRSTLVYGEDPPSFATLPRKTSLDEIRPNEEPTGTRISIPSALLRTSSAIGDSHVLSRPASTNYTTTRSSTSQTPRPVPAHLRPERVSSITIGILSRNNPLKARDWKDATARARTLRKTSLPLRLGERQTKGLSSDDKVAPRLKSPPKAERSRSYRRETGSWSPNSFPQNGAASPSPSHGRGLQFQVSTGNSSSAHREKASHYFSNFCFSNDSLQNGQDDLEQARNIENIRHPVLPDVIHAPKEQRHASFLEPISKPTNGETTTIANSVRKGSLYTLYTAAKTRKLQLQRQLWVQKAFEYTIYILLVLSIYFVLVGLPLWKGTVFWLWWVVAHKFVIAGGFSITVGLAVFYAFAPLLVLFEPYPPEPDVLPTSSPSNHDVALLIPCYKSAKLIGNTLEAALKIFPPSSIFVLANGNSPTPLDNTEEVCRPYGVNHVWSPIGSKIIAQFVGCYAAKDFKYVLMIDDDCTLPPNFPIVTDRMVGRTKSIGYTIKSTGPNSSRGTLCQQAQDLEYKLSGIQRAFAGVIGSATFPHGAISIWDRKFLLKTFHQHPGFSISEDWFFGHAARQLGGRITMCTSIFVETETPGAVFFSSGGSRGGFGEMTVFKQRFQRWNFFFVSGLWFNIHYILFSWKLGIWEFGAKIFVFQEVYETLLYLLSPFMLPISFVVRPSFCGYLLLGTLAMYVANVLVFNEIHLRRKNERIGWKCLWFYYLPYKIILTGINVGSCYWSLYKYAKYFAKRHPRIVEQEEAIEVVLRLEENVPPAGTDCEKAPTHPGRRMTVVSVRGSVSVPLEKSITLEKGIAQEKNVTLVENDSPASSDSLERSDSLEDAYSYLRP